MVPEVHIIAGPNGAGKSTLAAKQLPPGLEFVNADTLERLLPPQFVEGRSVQAGKLALRRISELEQQQISFAYETTLSGTSLAVRLRQMRAAGYRIILYYVWLQQDDLAVARVAVRVKQGGHDIPEADIRRYAKGLINFLDVYLPLADIAYGYDNSAVSHPLLIAKKPLMQSLQVVSAPLWGELLKEAQNVQANPPQ